MKLENKTCSKMIQFRPDMNDGEISFEFLVFSCGQGFKCQLLVVPSCKPHVAG